MSLRSVYYLNVALLALYWAACVVYWAQLPERIPHHFGPGGQPTSWARTSLPLWFGLPALAVALAAFLHWMGRAAERNPQLWNIPSKKRFLKLTPEQRAPVVYELRRMMAWVAVLVTLCFAGIQIAIYQSALGISDGFTWYTHLLLWGSIAAMLVVPLALMPRVRRMVARAEEQQAAGGG